MWTAPTLRTYKYKTCGKAYRHTCLYSKPTDQRSDYYDLVTVCLFWETPDIHIDSPPLSPNYSDILQQQLLPEQDTHGSQRITFVGLHVTLLFTVGYTVSQSYIAL